MVEGEVKLMQISRCFGSCSYLESLTSPRRTPHAADRQAADELQ